MTLMIASFWAKKKKKKVLEPARSEENPLMINRLSQYCTDVTLVAISCSLSKVRDS